MIDMAQKRKPSITVTLLNVLYAKTQEAVRDGDPDEIKRARLALSDGVKRHEQENEGVWISQREMFRQLKGQFEFSSATYKDYATLEPEVYEPVFANWLHKSRKIVNERKDKLRIARRRQLDEDVRRCLQKGLLLREIADTLGVTKGEVTKTAAWQSRSNARPTKAADARQLGGVVLKKEEVHAIRDILESAAEIDGVLLASSNRYHVSYNRLKLEAAKIRKLGDKLKRIYGVNPRTKNRR